VVLILGLRRSVSFFAKDFGSVWLADRSRRVQRVGRRCFRAPSRRNQLRGGGRTEGVRACPCPVPAAATEAVRALGNQNQSNRVYLRRLRANQALLMALVRVYTCLQDLQERLTTQGAGPSLSHTLTDGESASVDMVTVRMLAEHAGILAK
jgi:hypothetical protein